MTHEPLHLSFFWDAVEHISRLARALRPARGSAMLVGVGGSGQQPISRLGSFMCGRTYESVEFRKGYGVTEFREDLKKLYVRTGVKGEPLAVTLTEPEELFLADINTVLNSGEIPDLFTRDEMNSIVADMRPLCTQLGILETRDNIRALFLSRVRANLHLILMFSPGARAPCAFAPRCRPLPFREQQLSRSDPSSASKLCSLMDLTPESSPSCSVGSSFRINCRMFPSLINCCTIDWFDRWPEGILPAALRPHVAVGATRSAQPVAVIQRAFGSRDCVRPAPARHRRIEVRR